MRKSAKNQLLTFKNFTIMEQSNSGMGGHGMPIETRSNQTTKTRKQSKGKELAKVSKHDPIFHLVKDEQGKVNIIVGNYRVCQGKFDTFEQADNYIGKKPYELIFTTCNVMTNTIIQNEKNKETAKAAETDK